MQQPSKALTISLLLLVIVFDILQILGVSGPTFMDNSKCFAYLGCNAGFFGYDILVHFTSGISIVLILVWLMRKYPRLSILHGVRWKDILTLIICTVFIGVVWEFGEFARDQFMMKALNIDLIHPINLLAQTSNSDTMGDLFFEMFGATVASFIIHRNRKRSLVD